MASRVASGEQSKSDNATGDEPAQKRRRGENGAMPVAITGSFDSGEKGFEQAKALAAKFAGEGADALKGRLAALGMKAGGSPLERANRIISLQNVTSLTDVPKSLLVKSITFVKATAESEAPDATGSSAPPSSESAARAAAE